MHDFRDKISGSGDGQGGLAYCSSWGRKESDKTEQLNWTELVRVLWTIVCQQLGWPRWNGEFLEMQNLPNNKEPEKFNRPITIRTSLMAQTIKCLPTMWESWVQSWVRKISWRRKWQPNPVFLPGESHGQRSLAGYSPWGHNGRTWLSD